MSDDILYTATKSAVERPTGPKPRRSIHNMNNSNDRWSGTMPEENVSMESSKNGSSEESDEDTDLKGCLDTLLASRETMRSRLNISNSSPYSGIRKEVEREIEFLKIYNSHYRTIPNSSNSSSPDRSPVRPTHVQEQKKNESSRDTINEKQNHKICTWVLFAIIVIIVGFIICNYPKSEQRSNVKTEIPSSDGLDKKMTRKKVADLAKLFPSQTKSIWSSFTSGINDVRDGFIKPAVILLLAIDEQTTDCLVKKVAAIVSSTLGGSDYANLTTEAMGNKQSEVLSLVEKQLKRTKTVVFADILNMRPEAMKALHWILDAYHSLNGEAVYLITMKSELYKEFEKPIPYAELQIRNRFSSEMEREILDPLITRITAGTVLPIKAEETIPCQK